MMQVSVQHHLRFLRRDETFVQTLALLEHRDTGSRGVAKAAPDLGGCPVSMGAGTLQDRYWKAPCAVRVATKRVAIEASVLNPRAALRDRAHG